MTFKTPVLTIAAAVAMSTFSACGGGGGGKGGPVDTTPVITAPVITTQPASQTKTIGESVTFTVVASGTAPFNYQWKKGTTGLGTGSDSYAIASAATSDAGSYTVTVTNAAGSVTSNPALLVVGTLPPSAANALGMNIDGLNDWDEERLYADIMRTSRQYDDGAWNPIPEGVDEHGWPKGDFQILLWGDMPNMHGTYSLSFNGTAASVNVAGVGNVPTAYVSNANTSTGSFSYTPTGANNVWLTMTGTQRTSNSSMNTGVTNIKIMRPTVPGGSTPFASNVLFNTQLPKLLTKVQVVRFMDYLRTNANPQVLWTDRALPSYASHSVQPPTREKGNGLGGPYEHVILFANQTGKDVWLNVPAKADTTPITSVNSGVGALYGIAGMPASKTTYVVKVTATGELGVGATVQFSADNGAHFGSTQTPQNEMPIQVEGTPVWVGLHNGWYSPPSQSIHSFVLGDTFTFTLDPAAPAHGFVTKLAQLFAFGSDGVNPYTSPQANPVFPPLRSDLRLYVEYSNELWNYANGFDQGHWNKTQASTEVAAGGSPLNFDGLSDTAGYDYAIRRTAKRAVEISTIFRQVFGDAAMGPRIRPVIETQSANPYTLHRAMQMIWGYYGGGMANCSSQPYPPSYYFYGGGGSGYYDPKPGQPDYATKLDVNSIWTMGSMVPATFVAEGLERNTEFLAAMGLKQVAYEGGPSFDKSSTAAVNEVYNAAWSDLRMETAVKNNHLQAWDTVGGDLLVYYTATRRGDYQWAFTRDITDLTAPKVKALDDIAASVKGALTHGTELPATVEGNAFSVDSTGYTFHGAAYAGPYTINKDGRACYTFREPAPSTPRSVVLTIGKTPNGVVAVYVDGVQIETPKLATAGSMTFPAVNFSAGLHGVIVRAVSGSFSLEKVAVE